MSEQLTGLPAGTPIVHGGDRVTYVSEELAAAFASGDHLVVIQDTGDLLHVPAAERATAHDAVGRAAEAFEAMARVEESAIRTFYEAFAARLGDDATFAPIAGANVDDVSRARERGRSTTRLELSPRMRADMIAGLRTWRDAPSVRGAVVATHDHDGWEVAEVTDGLGVVAFVFEGRPNVFADATGVLLSGNTVVFRIGSDALGTARAIVTHALDPALAEAGLPPGAVCLVDAPAHAAGWALFADPRLALAVARGSGRAVAQLGAVARQAGNPVSLHGTGGAWIVAGPQADADAFASAVTASLDRKVCNTLNTCCIVRDRAEELVPRFLEALDAAAAARGVDAKLWVHEASRGHVPDERFAATATVGRASGSVQEPAAEPLAETQLGREWEWEQSPEVTLVLVEDVDEAVALYNRYAPHFVASLIDDDRGQHDRFFATIDAPFVGDGFTRWVDGQYALDKPELGLSNWEGGRLFGRSGILSGDSVRTVRMRATQHDPQLHR